MKLDLVAFSVAIALPLCVATTALADNQWQGGNGTPLNSWGEATNWDSGSVPNSATDKDVVSASGDELNVVRMKMDGTDTLIDSSVNATAFAIQLGHPKEGAFGSQSASNTLTMTGGSLTTQGNFLFNVGRGTNVLASHLVQFNMSGGLVNAAGITVPEAFSPGVGSVGINAEMHVSGSSVVNTDLLRLGAHDANSTVTVSDNAQINLTDSNNGFANGQLWLESFEDLDNTGGTSVLDISDNGIVTIHGGVNNIQADQTASRRVILDELIPRGMITADGGASTVGVSLSGGVITLSVVPEPASATLLLLSSTMFMVRRRK